MRSSVTKLMKYLLLALIHVSFCQLENGKRARLLMLKID
jgi:hypothetical protein